MLPICCWRAPACGSGKLQCGPRWGRAGFGSCGNYLAESVLLALIGGALGVLFARSGKPGTGHPDGGRAESISAGRSSRSSCPRFHAARRAGHRNSLGLGRAALSASRTGAGPSLHARSRNLTGSFEGRRLGQALVVSQVALSIVLVIGAGLLVRNCGTSKPSIPALAVKVCCYLASIRPK